MTLLGVLANALLLNVKDWALCNENASAQILFIVLFNEDVVFKSPLTDGTLDCF